MSKKYFGSDNLLVRICMVYGILSKRRICDFQRPRLNPSSLLVPIWS